MTQPNRQGRVRITDDAIGDLKRLMKRDPQIVRLLLRRMLLLERSPYAGKPLVGALIGFRKLVAGNRHYRIVWRVATDDGQTAILEVAEVWAAGIRSDGEVYDEMMHRVDRMHHKGDPRTRPLVEALENIGLLYSDFQAKLEPTPTLPGWLVQALQDQLRLSHQEIAALSQEEAQQLLAQHWATPRD